MSSHLLTEQLSNWLSRHVFPRDRLLVAFSGGPDSTALLWALASLSRGRDLQVAAAHFDHRLDSDSRRRAREARRLAAELEVPLVEGVAPAWLSSGRSISREVFARQHRYDFLRRVASSLMARFVVTAHHADDQAETVALRLLFGTGLEGLAAMRETRGWLARPLLRLRRAHLLAGLESSGLQPTHDPSNQDLTVPRNAVRSKLLPFLDRQEPEVAPLLWQVAAAASRANQKVEQCLRPLLQPRSITSVSGQQLGWAIKRDALESLPPQLIPPALTMLHREAGVPYPASAAARGELVRQLKTGGRLGCDCGDGWRWEGDSRTLRLIHQASPPKDFAYTLCVPGSKAIPELGLTVHLTRGQMAPWMFWGCSERAGLANFASSQVTVRNRRAGDRIQPLGCTRSRKLKDLLIDRRVPQHQRDRLPLLLVDYEIAWVPGVSISENFRLTDNTSSVVIAELEQHDKTDTHPTGPMPSGD